ncbi:hypothetical protein EV203_11670, partial [Caldanaerobacter subterraneus]
EERKKEIIVKQSIKKLEALRLKATVENAV